MTTLELFLRALTLQATYGGRLAESQIDELRLNSA